jgi:hypothetical protein
MDIKRLLTPSLNPTGLTASAGVLYLIVQSILNYRAHSAIIDPQVVIAAIGTVLALLTRQVVTPVKDPRDGNGAQLGQVAHTLDPLPGPPLTH